MSDSNRFSLKGKNVAVIGAGSGIAEAVARGCAEHGGRVRCLDLKADLAAATADRIRDAGGEAEDAQLDIRDAAAVEAAFRGIVEGWGRLDVVICSPSINVRKPLLEYTSEDFDGVVDVNLKGTLHVLQSAGRIMVDQGSGSVVLYTSIRSLVVEPGQSVYAATKAGIVQMMRTAAAEWGPSGVRVNAIAPGVTETPLTEPIKAKADWYEAYAARNIFQRWASPEEMVGPAVFLASDAASYVTGSVLFVDGGWTAVDGRYTPPGM